MARVGVEHQTERIGAGIVAAIFPGRSLRLSAGVTTLVGRIQLSAMWT